MHPGAALWRVFPWDPAAPLGAPFSPSYVPTAQSAGRFDVESSPALYLAESPEHAVAERLQRFRGQQITADHLTEWGRTLALVPVRRADTLWPRIVDLCDARELVRFGIAPDTLASRDLTRTRAMAQALYEQGQAGLRWWSSLSGDWHGVVLFLSRAEPGDLAWGEPEPLRFDLPALVAAAAAIGVRLLQPKRRAGSPGRRQMRSPNAPRIPA